VVSCYVCDELNHQIQVFRVSMEHLSENLEVLGQLMDNCHIQVELFRGNNRIQKCLIAFKLWNICDNVWNRTFARKFGHQSEGQLFWGIFVRKFRPPPPLPRVNLHEPRVIPQN